MCHRYWKCVEVSVYLWGIWRRSLYPDLLMLSGYSGYSGSGSRICSRTGKPHKCCEMFWQTGTCRKWLEAIEIYWYYWMLYADDVLHNSRRMDDLLLCEESAGRFRWSDSGSSNTVFFRYAGKCTDDDVMDGDHLSDRICSLFHGIAEWYWKNLQSNDECTAYHYGDPCGSFSNDGRCGRRNPLLSDSWFSED